MKERVGEHELEIQDSGAPRGEKNPWVVNLNGVNLYADYNGKKVTRQQLTTSSPVNGNEP